MSTGVRIGPVAARTPVGGGVHASDPSLGLDRPELVALAGVNSAPDTAPYFTGVGAAATYPLTAKGREVAAAANAAGVRSAAGLGTAATLNIDTDGTFAANSDTLVKSEKAIKSYVDTLISSNVHWKSPVRAATVAAGTLASSFENGDTIDGVVLATGNRILIKDQVAGTENGIYVVAASGAPTRATDVDADAEMPGATCVVLAGTANINTQWTCSNSTVTLGSTAITFVQLGGAAGTYTAGFGLGLTGTQFNIVNVALVARAGLTPAANKLGYFDSTTTEALTDFTAKGREVVGAADAAAIRTAAALGTAAVQNVGAFDTAGAAGTAQTNAQNYADAADRQSAAKADVKYATAAALPASTYANGTAGVGATLTGTANGALTVDGSAVTAGDRVLVKDEATNTRNGFYTVTAAGGVSSAFVLTRATDFDQPAVGVTGARVRVQAGTTNAGTSWELTTNAAITYGTTAITFASMVNTIGGAASTGTGGVVRSTSPTLVTPNLSTPSAIVLTNATGTAPSLTAGNATLAATVTTNANLTGPVTSVGNATTIGAGVVTLAMQADVATATVFYRKTAGAGAPEVQTLATLKTDLGLTGTNTGDQTAANPTATVGPAAVNGSATTFMRSDAAPALANTAVAAGAYGSAVLIPTFTVDAQGRLTAAATVALPVAVQADQETATSTTTLVTPGRQQFHPSACKCWGFTTGAGTPVLNAASYNVTSITDTAVGRLTVTIGTDFSSANWAGCCTTTNATATLKLTSIVTKAAGSVILESGSAATTLADPGVGWDWQFYGDQ